MEKKPLRFFVLFLPSHLVYIFLLFYITVQFLVVNLFGKAMQIFHLLSSFLWLWKILTYLTSLKADSNTGVFLSIFQNFY